MRELPPATSDEIARRAGSPSVTCVSGSARWYQPASRRRSGVQSLFASSRACGVSNACGGADNIAVFTQYISLLGSVEDDIVECFKNGGGVPYAKFPRFHAVMAEDSGQSVLSSLETHIVPLWPGLADRLAAGMQMLDIGCGRGRIVNRLAELYPRSRFTEWILSSGAVLTAWRRRPKETPKRGIYGYRSQQFDEKAEDEAFDLVTTFDAIHDQAKPLNVF